MQKNILAIIVLLVCIFALVGCVADKGGITTISAQVGKEMMDSGEVVIVDVREPYEYSDGHIDGAILLPLGDIEKDAERLLPDKDATIIVYCRSGRRSADAATKLAKLGYTKIYDMGGIIDWTKQGYEIV